MLSTPWSLDEHVGGLWRVHTVGCFSERGRSFAHKVTVPQGTVARVLLSHVVMSIGTTLQSKKHVIKAHIGVNFKVIHISKKWGFTRFNADEFEDMAEKHIIPMTDIAATGDCLRGQPIAHSLPANFLWSCVPSPLWLEHSGTTLAHCNLHFLGTSNSPHFSLLGRWDYRCPPLHPTNFFVFLVETGFGHVGRAGLELLISGAAHVGVWNSDPDILGQVSMVTPSPGFNRLYVTDVVEIKAGVQEERN
ncbi:60S ribosomal protein L10 [Plecturocebus cupreus]